MDTPRRWQVASLATAVAGLSVGGVMMGRSPSEAVPAIELEVPGDGRAEIASPETEDGTTSELELVPPSVLEDPTPPPSDSADSADEPAPAAPVTPRRESPPPAPTAPPTPPTPPDAPDSPDEPDSVEEPDSADSEG